MDFSRLRDPHTISERLTCYRTNIYNLLVSDHFHPKVVHFSFLFSDIYIDIPIFFLFFPENDLVKILSCGAIC